jgi:hypothetical protein
MPNEALVLDLVEWLARGPRGYDEVMRAWRTTCPRLTIWEDAVDAGLVQQSGTTVHVTPLGVEFLRARDRPACADPADDHVDGDAAGSYLSSVESTGMASVR